MQWVECGVSKEGKQGAVGALGVSELFGYLAVGVRSVSRCGSWWRDGERTDWDAWGIQHRLEGGPVRPKTLPPPPALSPEGPDPVGP